MAKFTKEKLRIAQRFYTHFFPLLVPKDSKNLKSWDIVLQEVGAKRRKRSEQMKNIHKKTLRFYTLYEQKFSILRPTLYITNPQGFQKSKRFGHWTSGSWGKKTVIQSETKV